MAKGNKVGEAYVEISADSTRLDAELRQSRDTVERETQAMGDSVQKNLIGKAEEAQSRFSALAGILTGFAGTIAIFGTLGVKIGELIQSFTRARDAADEFRSSVRELGDGEVQASIDGLAESTNSWWQNLKNGIATITDASGLTIERSREARIAILEEERAARQRLAVAERQAELERQSIERQREAMRRRQDTQRENEILEESMLSEEERAIRETERLQREAMQRIAEEEDTLARLALERQLELIRQIGQRRLEDIRAAQEAERQAAAERERLAAESARRQADALAQAMEGAFQRIADAQQINQTNTLASLRQMEQYLKTLADAGQFRRRQI